MRAALLFLMLLCASRASAQVTAVPATRAVIGLFTTFCVPNVGRPDDLRDAALHAGAHRLQPAAESFLLHSRPGMVFDFSAEGWHFALSSQDDGFCSAFAERADLASVFPQLEATLTGSHQDFTAKPRDPDPRAPGLVGRDYTIARDGRESDYAVTIDRTPGAVMQVVLSASPWHKPRQKTIE